MKAGMLRYFFVFFMIIFMASPALARSYSAVVVNAENGDLLYQVNPDAPKYPASLTKMMTAYMAFDALKKNQVNLDSEFTVSAFAAKQSPSKLGLAKGSKITVKNALLALATRSANDMAVTIAENLGGSESRFAAAMTQKARQLGMDNTTFRNASGLPNPGQRTTARDMAILAVALMRDFPEYYHFFSTTSFTYKGQVIGNHNKLLGHYAGADGIKTGYIHDSGFNLVASAKRDGHRLIGVVFGGKTPYLRDRHMESLLDQNFAKLADHPNKRPDELLYANYRGPSANFLSKSYAALPDNGSSYPRSAKAGLASDFQYDPRHPFPHRGDVAESDDMESESLAEEETATKPAAVAEADQIVTPAVTVKVVDTEEVKRQKTGWAIQIGAFKQYKQAKAALNRAAKLASATKAKASISTSKLAHNQVLYRARLVGIDKAAADQACRVLSQHQMKCLPLYLGKQVSMASLH